MRGGNVNGGFSNRNPRFRPADEFRRLMRGIGQHQCHRVCQSHVLRRADHNAPCDEPRVFAGMNHFRQPVKSRIHIAAAHGFDERRNRVVMRIAIAVVHHRFPLNALFRHSQVNMYDPIGPRIGRELRPQFPASSSALRASPSDSFCQVPQRCFIGVDFHVAESALCVGQRALQQIIKLLFRKWTQLENLRAGHERRIDEEEWIVRCRANQTNDSTLHVRQQHVLLRFVEAVDLVDEQDSGLALCFRDDWKRQPPATRRMSATFDSTPLSRSNLLRVCLAMICASEVLPVPGGP